VAWVKADEVGKLDLPTASRALPVIAWAGPPLGLVLSVIAAVVEGIAVNHDACVPVRTHELWPLPLSVVVLCWLGFGCAVAGTLAARGRVLRVVGVVVIVVGAVVLFLVYRTVFLTVPICVSEGPVSGS
jgi:hypothetical protein